MDLGLSEEQEMLRNFARDFLEKECPETLVRAMEDDEKGHSPELWQKMAQQGWQGLIIPEKYGGHGMPFADPAGTPTGCSSPPRRRATPSSSTAPSSSCPMPT